jgi:hypothetical protein
MQYDCHVTMEMEQTHCHATVPVALLWKCYKDLSYHNILALCICYESLEHTVNTLFYLYLYSINYYFSVTQTM